MNALYFSSAMKLEVHFDVPIFLDKHTLQCAALSIIERASKFAIYKDNASRNAGDVLDAAWSIASNGAPEVFLVETDEFEVEPLPTTPLAYM